MTDPFAGSGPAQGAAERRVSGGELLARALQGASVRTVFTLAGGHVMKVLDACIPLDIRVVDVRHESAATLGAEGWALATGELGVAVVTAGPGFTNAMTGLFDAGLGNAPVLLLGGRTGLRMAGQGAVGDLDQRAIAAPGVKWAATCYDAARIPRYVEEAVYRARAGRPGAVYLEVPQDVLVAEVEAPASASEGFPSPPPRSTAPAREVEAALALLRGAEKPLVVAGGGAFWSGAGDAIRRLCEVARLPVTTTSSARGLIPDSHPCCLGSLVHGGIALVMADVVLVLGSAFNANLGYGRPPLFGQHQTVIQVDVAADAMGGNRRPDLALAGDVSAVVEDLAAGWSGAPPDGREEWLREARGYVQSRLPTRQEWETATPDIDSLVVLVPYELGVAGLGAITRS